MISTSQGEDRVARRETGSWSLSGLRVRNEGSRGRGRFVARLRRIVDLFNVIERQI